MNIENKKQLATILLAVGLGLVAAFLVAQYIKTDINNQTRALALEYEKRSQALVQEIQATQAKIQKLETEVQAQKAMLAAGPKGAGGPGAQPVQVTSFAVKTPFGKRALTIMIDSLSAVGGLVNAGDFVDILAHLDIPKTTNTKNATPTAADTQKITTVLFQDIQVLAVNTNFEPVGNPPQYQSQQQAKALYLTLAVTPEESGLLTFAQAHGKLQLSLRPPAEKETQSVEVASWDKLSDFVFQKQGTKLNVPQENPETESGEPAKERPSIQIFRGGYEL